MKNIRSITMVFCFGLAISCGGSGEEAVAVECYDDGGYCIDASITGNFQVIEYIPIEGDEEMPSYEVKDDDQVDILCASGDNTEDGFVELGCLATGEYVYVVCVAGEIAYLGADDDSRYSTGCSQATYYCTSANGFLVDDCNQ